MQIIIHVWCKAKVNKDYSKRNKKLHFMNDKIMEVLVKYIENSGNRFINLLDYF